MIRKRLVLRPVTAPVAPSLLLKAALLTLCTLTLVLNAAALGVPNGDDKSDAWVSVSQMLKFIETGDKASTEKAGNDAINSLEKAIDNQDSSDKKDKLRDAKAQVREALGNASRGEWPYAEGAAKRALKLIEDVK
jgi:hypothetical protein